MSDLIKIDPKVLAEQIELFFKDADVNKLHFWERDIVAKSIKDNIKKIGKWKYRKRGNPKAGYIASQKKLNKTD